MLWFIDSKCGIKSKVTRLLMSLGHANTTRDDGLAIRVNRVNHTAAVLIVIARRGGGKFDYAVNNAYQQLGGGLSTVTAANQSWWHL